MIDVARRLRKCAPFIRPTPRVYLTVATPSDITVCKAKSWISQMRCLRSQETLHGHLAVPGRFAISSQVLSEFAATLLHTFSPPAPAQAVIALLDRLSPIKLIVPDGDLVRRALDARVSYGLHFYDGMIVAAAERAGCARIWSEDLHAGQTYFGVTVVNPFL